MAWLIPKLTHRVQILKPTQEPNDDGGFDFGFGIPMGEGFESGSFEYLSPLKTVWMGLNPVGYKGTGLKYIRGKQVSENVTHEFVARYLSVLALGKAFSGGFDSGYKSMSDLSPLKSDYYLFLENGSKVKGRLFKIDSISNDKEQDEFLSIAAEEVEERGTGYPA